MKNYIKNLKLASYAYACAMFALVAQAETVTVSDVEISYTGAQVKQVGDDVLLVFTNASAGANNTFTIPENKTAKTHLFLVGGGGAGGTVGQDLTRGAAGGGGAGGVSDRNVMLSAGTYTVIVGEGGATAQTSVQSWVGDDGQSSAIALGDSGYIASTKGGGGGGSVKIGGEGTPGASGGGGSWYGEFMEGGAYTEGYGWQGGTPTDEAIGGGGGGASRLGAEGAGGADGHAGAGRTNDITGVNVEYARGGRGGRRGDASYKPSAGATYGSGGDGAVNGPGGKGADGIVIVRFSKVFEYKYVDFPVPPVYTNSFVWANGESFVALDMSKASDDFKAAIAKVDGVTNTTCSITDGGATTNGLGRFKFTLYLNDEYKWNDGGDGNTSPYVTQWRVKEPDVVGEITVEVTKKVDWFEGTNATIAIDVHSTPETRIKTPKVLMLGSLCYKHGLTHQIVKTALDTLANVADVDVYFFLQVNSKTDSDLNNPVYEKHLKRGDTVNDVPTTEYSNMHGTLYAFYEYLDRARLAGTEYDYIVLSFDRAKVATTFPGAHSHESEVVQYIKKFYDRGAVVWMVDGNPATCTTLRAPNNNSTQRTVNISQSNPWTPSQLVSYQQNGQNTWTTFQGYINQTSANGETAVADYKALMGMFSPDNYANATTTYNNNIINTGNDNATTCVNKYNNAKGTANPNQVVYDDADEVAKILEDVVKPTIATMQLEDHVYLENGLKINATEGYWTTNETQKADTWETAQTDWTKLKPNELTNSDTEGVRIAISNVTTDVWLKLKVGVHDTGRFLSSVNATYNEQTGLWEKDPNNGPVQVKMTPNTGTEVLAEDQASTSVEWAFEAFKITGGVVWGEGEFIINGFFTNLISVAKGYNPEVLFRGAPGWAVNYINVDGVVLDEVNYKTNWFFGAINADHDIRVGFTNIVVDPPPPVVGPVTNVYDGTGYAPETVVPPTFAEGYEEYSNMWYMVYSTDPDADPTDRDAWSRDGVITNVVLDANGDPQPQTVYCRICLEQPGYEDGAVVPYWIGTNTVTILPRELEITFDDYVQTTGTRKTTDFTYGVTGGDLVEGDTLSSNTGRCTNYPSKGSRTEDSITNNGAFHVTSPDGSTDNYVITVIPGDYIYPNLDVVADADDIVKYYDAVATGIVVDVAYPLGGSYTKTGTSTSSDTYQYSSRYNQTRVSNGRVVSSGGTQYYNVVSNWTDTTTTTVTCTETIEYSEDGGKTWTTTSPQYTDAGEYEVMYRVNYSSNITTSVTREAWLTGRSNWNSSSAELSNSRHTQTFPPQTTTVNYTTATGTATVTIKPREVTVTAGSAEKIYNGTPLTESSSTNSPAGTMPEGDQSGKGFITGEGLASVPMTAGSTITNPGTVANVVNSNAVTYVSGTNPKNYVITYEPGTLVVTPNQIVATSSAQSKVYDGQVNSSFSVDPSSIKDKYGNVLDPSTYTIKYKTNPWDDYTLDAPPANTNSGDYVVYYQVIPNDGGFTPVEGHSTYKITPRTVTLIADGAVKFYDGDPLVTNTFTVAASTGASDGFVNGEGVSALVMTPASTITEPGDKPNVIDPNTISNWVFTGGLTETTFKQNYVYTLIPSNLEVKVQARALWIIDHENPGDGYVYLAFEPELLNETEGISWVSEFAAKGKFKVKYGQTRAEADACEPVVASLSGKPGHEPTAEKVWLKVALKDIVRDETIVDPQGFWRIVIDGPAKHLTDAEEDFGYDTVKKTSGPSLQGATLPGSGTEILGTNGAVSVNTFGILKIERATTNTMVAVPWTWYSKIQRNAEDIPVKKLLKTTNLDEGDMVYTPVDNDTYAAWTVENHVVTTNGVTYTNSEWSAVKVVKVDQNGLGRMSLVGDDDEGEVGYDKSTRIARGNGLWLYRQRPLDADKNPRPFWLYGQSVTTEVTTVVSAPTGSETVHSTMIGNPYAQDIVLNSLDFQGTIDTNDRIKIHTEEGINRDLIYVKGKGWREFVTRVVDGVKKSGYTYQTVIPAGMAFWYDRRGTTDLTIKWPLPTSTSH